MINLVRYISFEWKNSDAQFIHPWHWIWICSFFVVKPRIHTHKRLPEKWMKNVLNANNKQISIKMSQQILSESCARTVIEVEKHTFTHSHHAHNILFWGILFSTLILMSLFLFSFTLLYILAISLFAISTNTKISLKITDNNNK